MQPQDSQTTAQKPQTLAYVGEQLQAAGETTRGQTERIKQVQAELRIAERHAHGKPPGHHNDKGDWVASEEATRVTELRQQERECFAQLDEANKASAPLRRALEGLLQESKNLEEQERQMVKELAAPDPSNIQARRSRNDQTRDQILQLLADLQAGEVELQRLVADREQWRVRRTADLEQTRARVRTLKGDSRAVSQ